MAAISKLPRRKQFVFVVIAYRVLPRKLATAYAYFLPGIELVVGLLLLVGIAARATGAVSGVLLASFVGAMALNVLRGRTELDCGCFGSSRQRKISSWAIVENCLLLLLAIFAMVSSDDGFASGSSPIAVDIGTYVAVLIAAAMIYPLGRQALALRLARARHGAKRV